MVTVSPSCDFSNHVKMMQIPYTFVSVVCVWARVLHISFASEIEFTFFSSQLKMSSSLKQLVERMTTASNAIEDEKSYIMETLFISISFNTEDNIFKVLHSANLDEIKSYLSRVKEGFNRAQATLKYEETWRYWKKEIELKQKADEEKEERKRRQQKKAAAENSWSKKPFLENSNSNELQWVLIKP